MIEVKGFLREDIEEVNAVWNKVVTDGRAFPQSEPFDIENGIKFFESQTFTGVAYDTETNEIVGVYILHPNFVGRCSHICNTSYAVKDGKRGQGIGEKIVSHSLKKAKECGFKILQLNAVIASNAPALRLYKKLGLTPLGAIKDGFLNIDGEYEDIIPHYINL
ncbi:MAG: GNAT family N-acetyltransferase [Clostridia bacterium]|nr:GNAT family N-acetyltransferase [Clostridia bacterium]